jgi:lysophospholipase L1-like esterase
MSLRPLPPVRRHGRGRGGRASGRVLAAGGGFLLVAALLVAGSPATAAAGDEHLAGLEYVALGDSYAAGYGILPSTGLPVTGCDQSTTNYPHLTATELGLALTDVTCSGAETANITTTAQVTYSGTAPIQLTSLSASTDIVTLTVGGNDLGFVDILTSCAAFSSAGPVIAGTTNCAAFYSAGGVDSLAAAVAGPVTTALETTLAAIAVAAPNAKVFVVGYPALTPGTIPGAGCFRDAAGTFAPPFPVNAYPYQDADVAYLHTVEVKLDQAISDAATDNGAVYLSNLAGTDAHSPCATTDAYVNGITVSTLSPAVTLEPGAMHPNAVGAAYLATGLEAAIRVAFPAPEPPAGPTGGGLAATGTDSGGWLAFTGILLLLAGGAMVRLRQRAAG